MTTRTTGWISDPAALSVFISLGLPPGGVIRLTSDYDTLERCDMLGCDGRELIIKNPGDRKGDMGVKYSSKAGERSAPGDPLEIAVTTVYDYVVTREAIVAWLPNR